MIKGRLGQLAKNLNIGKKGPSERGGIYGSGEVQVVSDIQNIFSISCS